MNLLKSTINFPSLMRASPLIFLLLLGCAGAGISSVNTTNWTAQEVAKLQKAGDKLSEAFSNAEQIGTRKNDVTIDMSGPVEEIVRSCCVNSESIVALMESAGFKVFPNRHDTNKPDIEQNYDERIVSERKVDQLLYVWKTQRLIAYLDHDRLVGVSAYVFQDGL